MPDKDAPYTWSKEELKRIDPEPIVFEGQTFDAYQCTQQQRKIERAIRKTKRELIALDSAIKAAPDELKEALQTSFDAKSVMLKRQRELYQRFSKAANLKEQNERAQEHGFDRSLSARASAAARKHQIYADGR